MKRGLGYGLLAAFVWLAPAQAQKFYPDDPIWQEPPPRDTVDPQEVALSGVLEYFTNQFTRPGERQPAEGVIPAQNANTLGEVPDSSWFTNRHGRNRMTLDELVAGPGNADPPRQDEPWRVLTVKRYGDRTGMLIADADNTVYLLRFDPGRHVELQTGAQMVSSKFYYAAGYNVLESYLVDFDRERLVVPDGAEEITSFGELRDLLPEDIDRFLEFVARNSERGYRAVATRAPYTKILGNYQLYGTRSDDPNDIVPHEHRRDLRGMWALHAWLGNNQFLPANTLEAVVSSDGAQYIRRYIIDFFKTLGAGENGPKEARDGNEYRFNLNRALKNVATMGVVSPAWAKADYPGLRGVGRFEGDRFDADAWTADTYFVTWTNRLPDDLYWGAKLVMSFTDEEIRAIVDTGGYSDTRATCDRKQVGAVIVVDYQVAATGYNGSIRGLPHCDEVGHDMVDGHCVRTIHAEMNALAQAARRGVRIEGAFIYTTASPCWSCFRVLVNAGIRRFVYGEAYREEDHRKRISAVAERAGLEVKSL